MNTVMPFLSLGIFVLYALGAFMILIIMGLTIQALTLSIRALKKYLQE